MITNRLKNIRMQEHMLGKKDFAKMLEIELTQYSRYESGKTLPSLEKAFEIAFKLEKSVTDIWGYEKNQTKTL